MEKILFDSRLSKYDRYILNKIIIKFEVDNDFNIYELVEEAVSYKCLLPSQNTIIMETYYAIKEHLIACGFLTEKREMSNYFLTERGRQLKAIGSIERFEEKESKMKKRSLIQKFFFKNTIEQLPDLSASY
jgi:hypothetical protein